MRWSPESWQERIGTPGVVAIGLLVCAAMAYFSAVRPLATQVSAVERQASAAKSNRATPATTHDSAAAMTVLLAALPKEAELGAHLASLHMIGRHHGVQLDRGNFERVVDSRERLARQGMTFQAVAGYASLRRFIAESLQAHPLLALEEIVMTPKVGDPTKLEARLRFSLLYRPGGGDGPA